MDDTLHSYGVGMTYAHTDPAVAERIEWLGQANERRLTCLANNDMAGLLALADEYEQRGMKRTAAIIRFEVREREMR